MAGAAPSISEGIARAAEAIDTGAASRLLDRLTTVSKRGSAA